MNRAKYQCPNGCKLPPRRKTICEDNNGNYYWGYHDFPFCPVCGSLMPQTIVSLKGFFDFYQIHPKLKHSVELIYKSELGAAVREAYIVLETTLQEKSGLTHLWGKDLAAQALKFKYDTKEKVLQEAPLIAINKLDTPSRVNEQEGLMYMLMGYFQGTRNIYQHKLVGTSANMIIISVLQISYFLKLLDGQSITVNGHWIPTSMSVNSILSHTPKKLDRMRIRRSILKSIKKRNRLYTMKRKSKTKQEKLTEDK